MPKMITGVDAGCNCNSVKGKVITAPDIGLTDASICQAMGSIEAR